jgi:hypothetical protein
VTAGQLDMFAEALRAGPPLANPATPQYIPAATFAAPEGVRSRSDADAVAALLVHLEVAVPAHMGELRDLTPEQRRASLPHGWQGLAGMADTMLFPAPGRSAGIRRSTILSYSVYARGLAVLAYEDGGVNLFGGHWCRYEHDGCPVGAPTPIGEPWAELMGRIRWALAQPDWQKPLAEYKRLRAAERAAAEDRT